MSACERRQGQGRLVECGVGRQGIARRRVDDNYQGTPSSRTDLLLHVAVFRFETRHRIDAVPPVEAKQRPRGHAVGPGPSALRRMWAARPGTVPLGRPPRRNLERLAQQEVRTVHTLRRGRAVAPGARAVHTVLIHPS